MQDFSTKKGFGQFVKLMGLRSNHAGAKHLHVWYRGIFSGFDARWRDGGPGGGVCFNIHILFASAVQTLLRNVWEDNNQRGRRHATRRHHGLVNPWAGSWSTQQHTLFWWSLCDIWWSKSTPGRTIWLRLHPGYPHSHAKGRELQPCQELHQDLNAQFLMYVVAKWSNSDFGNWTCTLPVF